MKMFELLQIIVFIIPLGIFTTFGLLLTVTMTMRVREMNKKLKKFVLFYCMSAFISSLLFLFYYYIPQWFSFLDVLYCSMVIFTMVFFYRFICFAIDQKKEFNNIHFILPAFVSVAMFGVKILLPEYWEIYSSETLFGIASLFGITYSILPFARMYQFQINLIRSTGVFVEIDGKRAIPFIFAIVLFPVVFTILPFFSGHNPGVVLSILLMISIVAALVFNIPLIYELVRHYTVYTNNNFLLIPELLPESGVAIPPINIELPMKTIKVKEAKPVAKKKVLIKEFDKEILENYMQKYKPYLEISYSISELVEALHVNRTYLSGFINRTYNMNFNAWINLYRSKELERLLHLSTNEGKTAKDLFVKAGFANYRNYLRTIKEIKIEEVGEESGKNKEIN